ncbi:NUDIX hydrolase domain-like protein, partial [Ochromonadaceae sp. CCMP2298]
MRFFTLLIVLCTGPSFSLISHRALNSVQTRHLQQRLTDTDAASTTTWVADGLSQSDLMHKDECIVVNERDSILGHRSKYDTHKFTAGNPAGVLHRAFSVFLFDAQGRLLLQKRAASKITFPGVWTNTCCSHPLYGYQPCEVDDAESVSSGSVLGVRHAAIRKLQHELGIAEGRFSVGDFKYLTRLHYSAPDEFTRGTAADPSTSEEEKASDPFRCWGESEVDYILLL